MDGRAAWSVVGRKRPRRVGLRVVSGCFVIFPRRAAACNRKLGTARLGRHCRFPLPFRQRERVYIVCISELSARKTEERGISRPLGAWKLPQRVGRREKSTVRGILPYPMGVARYRPPRTADFSRKEVGRHCLPVGDFRTRAGATHVQAHTLPGWRPVFGIPRPGRAVSVPLAEPSVSLPVLLFALYPLHAA